jgi:SAM-dependent methyltransferase
MKGVTSYSGLAGWYFSLQLTVLIRFFGLHRESAILDFGCGYGMLKKRLGASVIGYDKLSELSDSPDWRKEKFDVFIANHVFYCFDEAMLRKLLEELTAASENGCRVIVGYSFQSSLVRLFMALVGRSDAHDGTQLTHRQQLSIVGEYLCPARHVKVYGLFGFCEFIL